MSALDLSIVISTMGRPKLLDLCLRSLALTKTDPARWEIIIIDDGSSLLDKDQNQAVVNWVRAETGITASLYYRSMNIEIPNNVALPRNCGLKKAKGKYVAFVDGDCIFVSDVIQRAMDWIKVIEDTYVPTFMTSGDWDRISQASGGEYHRNLMVGGASCSHRGANSSVPFGPWFSVDREVMMKIHGFDERFFTYGGEDEDLVTRLMRLHYFPFRDTQVISIHLYHPPGIVGQDIEQHKKQLAWINRKSPHYDKTNVRNKDVEWGQLCPKK